MLKKISAMKARQNLGQLLNEVSIRGDAYIIERAGKPLAALVDMEKFQQLQEDRGVRPASAAKGLGENGGSRPPGDRGSYRRGAADGEKG